MTLDSAVKKVKKVEVRGRGLGSGALRCSRCLTPVLSLAGENLLSQPGCRVAAPAGLQTAEPPLTGASGLRLEIAHRWALSFDLDLKGELQRRQNERCWAVILSLLKKKKNTLKFDENGGGARVSAYSD